MSNPDANHVSTPRHNYVRIPCPPPDQTALGGPPGGGASVGQGAGHDQPLHPFNWNVGVGAGALWTTSTFDDGFKVRGTVPALQLRVETPAIPLGGKAYLPVDFEMLIPLGHADKEFARTSLPVVGSIGLEPQVTFTGVGGYAAMAFFGPTLDIGAITAGSTFPGASFSNTQTMIGWGLEGGARTAIAPGLLGEVKVTYVNLPFHRFDSPTGDFKMKQEGLGLSIGLSRQLR